MRHLRVGCVLVAMACWATATSAQERITLSIRDVIERSALLFNSSGDTGVVLAHQSGSEAASWSKFAKRMQAAGVGSIALESISEEDVQSGIAFLRQLGKQRIVLIGASLGGAAVQSAATQPDEGMVDTVILLGTAEGDMSDAVGVDKFFVISEGDFFAPRTHASFQKASEPKELLTFPGTAHAQDMLNETYGEELIQFLLNRILQ